MNIPSEAQEIFLLIGAICLIWGFVTFFTRKGRYHRNRRNKRARRQV